MRFYQVDKVTELCPGKYVEGVKCVSLDNDIFDEHFPGHPIFPGTLILEGLAQLSGMFLEWCRKDMGFAPRRAALSIVQKLKFRDMVTPGERPPATGAFAPRANFFSLFWTSWTTGCRKCPTR